MNSADDCLYWFGNMQYPEAYEASLVFPDRDELKSNTQDGDTVVIYRAGSWSDLASEIEAEAKSRGIAPVAAPVSTMSLTALFQMVQLSLAVAIGKHLNFIQ